MKDFKSVRYIADIVADAAHRTVGYCPYEVLYEAISNKKIVDMSYSTVKFGVVAAYSGEATIEYKGETFLLIGHGPEGGADYVSREGWIEVCQ
jgi:hypothetical protein